jgi:predicted transcriptional regulator
MGMKLNTYMQSNNISKTVMASLLDVAEASVYRYLNGQRIPEKPVMRRLFKITNGQVVPNDFYDLE